jgi:tetratricopeptide (TPR) repeat protein
MDVDIAEPSEPVPETSPNKGDANDYSRFEGISDSDSDSEDPASKTPEQFFSVSESIFQSNALKELGNTSFKENQYVEAKLHYEQVIKLLTPHKNLKEPAVTATQTVEIKNLLISAHGNTAMVQLKQEDWTGCLKSAEAVLTIDATNVKALYRRATCRTKLGRLEESKADLLRVLELDENNSAAKKDLFEITKILKLEQQREKAAFSNMFSKGSMYEDREHERNVKLKKQEDERRREQDEWTQSKLQRREQGLLEQTFEEWKKERDDKKKASKAPSPKKTKTEVPRPVKSTPAGSANALDEEEYDEEESRLIRETKSKGYCYFKNQPSAEAKELIGDIRPKALGEASEAPLAPPAAAAAAPVAVVPEQTDAAGAPVARASSWNHAGTWEERDFTQLVKDRLNEIGSDAFFEQVPQKAISDEAAIGEGMMAVVKEVKSCTGDAQVVLTRGKKRHIFDFNMDLKFEVQHKGSHYSGHIEFRDLSPGNYDSTVTFKKALPHGYEREIRQCAHGLRDVIVERIRSFEAEYKSM